VEPLGAEDYFAKNPEFCVWLVEARGLYFSELSAAEARGLFEGAFLGEWNGRRLAEKFYRGVPGGVGVPRVRPSAAGGGPSGRSWGKSDGGGGGSREERRRERKRAERAEREKLEEMFPRATGRDALREKRAAARVEGRARAASPDLVAAVPGGGAGGLMGGGDSFSEAVAKQRQRQGRRQEARREQVSAKLKAHQAAEDAKMAQFRAILAQQQGGGGIPKRPQEQ